MREALAVALAGLVALVLQTTLLPALPFLPVLPDLVLAVVVWVGLQHHGGAGVAGAFLLGYAMDTYAGTPLGTHAFAMTAAYLAAYALARTVWTEGGASTVVVVFLCACVRQFALVVVAVLGGGAVLLWRHFLRDAALEAVAAALTAPLVFGFLRWERRKVFRVV